MVEPSPPLNLSEYIKQKSAPLIEGPDPEEDISYQWVTKNEELKLIEEGIPFEEFSDSLNQRNLEMEFRVISKFLFLIKINFLAIETNDGKHLSLPETKGF